MKIAITTAFELDLKRFFKEMKMNPKRLIFTLMFVLTLSSSISASDWPQVRQGEYAKKVVQALKIQNQLPLAYNEQDCISLLESRGISPLKGWSKDELLTQDDYVAVVMKANGKEKKLHDLAQNICDQNLNQSNGECPYGQVYQVQADGTLCSHQHVARSPLKWALFPRQ